MNVKFESELSKRFGAKLRKLRTDRDLTQDELRQLIGSYKGPQLTEIETGKKAIPPHLLEKLAGALDISYPEMLALAGYHERTDVGTEDGQGVDLKVWLETGFPHWPTYNGRPLTEEERKRALLALEAVFYKE